MLAPAHRIVWVLCAAALAAPSAARAQEDPDGAPRRRVAVLLMSVGAVEAEVADGLSEVLIGTVAARGGVTIIGRGEFQARLGQGDEGTLECIGSPACLGRVGVQLDVAEVIAGTIARRGGVWVFNLNRTNVATGEIEGRVFREIEGDLGQVADALHDAIEEVYRPPPDPDPVPVTPPAPVTGALSIASNVDGAEVFLDEALLGMTAAGRLDRAGLEPGTHEVTVSASGYHLWTRSVRIGEASTAHLEVRLREAYDEWIHPIVWIAGAVAVAALGTAIPVGVASQDALELTLEGRRQGTPTRAEALVYYQDREREAVAATALYIVGATAALTAFIAIFFPERERRGAPARAGVRLTPGGLEGWF